MSPDLFTQYLITDRELTDETTLSCPHTHIRSQKLMQANHKTKSNDINPFFRMFILHKSMTGQRRKASAVKKEQREKLSRVYSSHI